MKVLCLFAHPDDETVACGGTLHLLAQAGHKVNVILATTGQAGEVHPSAKHRLEVLGNLENLRRQETHLACKILNINNLQFLNYRDGQITNQQSWGTLTDDFTKAINRLKPELLITFDHTGWYFHLDHVAVSIAATRAIEAAKHPPTTTLFNLFHPPGIKDKWPYIYPHSFPITHMVDIRSVINIKIQAIKAHASQNISLVKPLKEGKMDREWFQLINPNPRSWQLLKQLKDFKPFPN